MANSYREAGVDIDAGNAAVAAIRAHARSTFGPAVVTGIGGFGGLYAYDGGPDAVLVASADGVGTKVKVAIAVDRHDTVGADLVNHCVNDILCCGARPLFFLDYLGLGRVRPSQVEQIVAGMAAACRANRLALIGGETAEMPDLYRAGEYDVAGFIVGVVARNALVDGTTSIQAGDTLLGLPSTGLHTNGYSLARRVLGLTGDPAHDRSLLESVDPMLGGSWADALLAVHRSYLDDVGPLLDAGLVKGLAHITGGGLIDNVPRMLPTGLGARFSQSAWRVPPLFQALRLRGDTPLAECYRVYNMGLGMVIACAPAAVADICQRLPGTLVVGEVVQALNSDAQVTIES
jgi:phosphoribosylformylglycinamidine cyclo-ligase